MRSSPLPPGAGRSRARGRPRTRTGRGSPATTRGSRTACACRATRTRAVAERTSAVLTARRFASSTSVGTIDAERDRGAIEALGAAHDAGVARHDRCSSSRIGAVGRARAVRARRRAGAFRGRSLGARRWRRARPCPGRSPRRRARRTPGLEQRVRRQPVRAVDAGARGLAARPEAGQRRRPVEIGADAAGQVVRRRRDRQPVAGGVETDALAGAARSSGTASRSRRCRWRRATGGRARAR